MEDSFEFLRWLFYSAYPALRRKQAGVSCATSRSFTNPATKPEGAKMRKRRGRRRQRNSMDYRRAALGASNHGAAKRGRDGTAVVFEENSEASRTTPATKSCRRGSLGCGPCRKSEFSTQPCAWSRWGSSGRLAAWAQAWEPTVWPQLAAAERERPTRRCKPPRSTG